MAENTLTETSNFFQLYKYISGKSEVPEVYHFWCCVSLLSAAMEDRFTCELYKDIPLKPNLYIGLVGPGSFGKGLAISQALTLLEKSIDINIYRGRATFAHLIDRMGANNRGDNGNTFVASPRIYLVMDELKNGVGSNRGLVDEFISFMTEAYTATHYTLRAGSRTTGEVAIEDPCLNWLFGSTPVWLKKVLTRDIYESGFVARTCFVLADEDLDTRVPRIFYPKDRGRIYDILKDRLWYIKQMNGKLLLNPEAEDAFDNWYYNRKKPEEQAMTTIWKRQKELVIRFSMINCLADFKGFIIEPQHIQKAVYMAHQLFKYSEAILEVANENWETKPIAEVEQRIQKLGEIGHSDLLRYMRSKKGYNADKLKKIVGHLRDEKKIKLGKTKNGGLVYIWA